MRLEKIQAYIRQQGWKYTYHEEDGLGSIDFEARGLKYHIWEYPDDIPGAESNVRTAGRQEDYTGDYEAQLLEIMQSWKH